MLYKINEIIREIFTFNSSLIIYFNYSINYIKIIVISIFLRLGRGTDVAVNDG